MDNKKDTEEDLTFFFMSKPDTYITHNATQLFKLVVSDQIDADSGDIT